MTAAPQRFPRSFLQRGIAIERGEWPACEKPLDDPGVSRNGFTHRDAKRYFAVLLDDNNRKPIARLHFNGRQKYLGILDEQKTETRHPIDELDAIYEHADAIREAVVRYR